MCQDMARLCGLFSGDLRCFFGGPKIICAKQPCARINVSSRSKAAISHYCVDKMRLWGYFVEPSSHCSTLDGRNSREGDSTLRVLWVGRLLNWKRVDTIIKAVLHYAEERKTNQSLPRILLDIYGTGPEYLNLMRLASSNPDVVVVCWNWVKASVEGGFEVFAIFKLEVTGYSPKPEA